MIWSKQIIDAAGVELRLSSHLYPRVLYGFWWSPCAAVAARVSVDILASRYTSCASTWTTAHGLTRSFVGELTSFPLHRIEWETISRFKGNNGEWTFGWYKPASTTGPKMMSVHGRFLVVGIGVHFRIWRIFWTSFLLSSTRLIIVCDTCKLHFPWWTVK